MEADSDFEYLIEDYLQVHADEFPILFDKILINFTEFFRDPESWGYLATNIIPRVTGKDGPIRVWSAGGASGEEAYTAEYQAPGLQDPRAIVRTNVESPSPWWAIVRTNVEFPSPWWAIVRTNDRL